jgi:molecular chaperone GrpE
MTSSTPSSAPATTRTTRSKRAETEESTSHGGPAATGHGRDRSPGRLGPTGHAVQRRGAGRRSRTDAGAPQRIAELEAALAAAKAEAAEHWDKYLRERAEMENYKKRLERTYADREKRGRKDLLLKVLGVLDNLDLALSYQANSGQAVDAQGLLTGLKMTHGQFKDVLQAEGVKHVPSIGAQFDPALHEAVATEVAPDKPDGEIVVELQKGYTYDDELLRPARVKVATKG